MTKLRELLERPWASVGAAFIFTVLAYTLIVALFSPSVASWLNGVTDIAIGFYLGTLSAHAIDTAKKGKKYFTWQYGLFLFVCLGGAFNFYSASRVDTVGEMIVGLFATAVSLVLAFVVHRIIYYPSTKTFEELQEAAWERMKEKLPKIGREKFLAWEKGFRVCATTDGTLDGDLDFSNLFATVDADGTKIPMTFNGAQAKGYSDVALSIHETLVSELDRAGIK